MGWGILLSLIKKIPYQLWLLVGVLFSFWLYGAWQFDRGQRDIQKNWDASVIRGKAIVADLELRANTTTYVIEERIITETKVLREKADTIIKEIPIYIPNDSPDLPGGFRLLHDAAARSELPRQADLPGQPVSVADATRTITLNYATCLQWRKELDGWDRWHQEQSLVWQTVQHK